MKTVAPPIAPVFRSEGQLRVLSELFLAASPELSAAEVARRTGLSHVTAWRELSRLAQADLVTTRKVGQATLVRPNDANPAVAPLRQLLMVATGPVPRLRAELEPIDGILAAVIFGSFAARRSSEPGPMPNDVDVLVVGSPDPGAVYDACIRVGRDIGRSVNPTIMTPHEWAERTPFTDDVRKRPRLAVLGELP